MSVKILTENLKNKSLLPLYYIYGEEEYLKQHYFSEIRRCGVTDLPEFNYSEFEGKSFVFDEFSNSVDSYPVMTDHKVISVINFENSSLTTNFIPKFVEFLKTIPDYCTVVFLDTDTKNIGEKNLLLEAINAAGGIVVHVEKPSASNLVTWIKRHFKSGGKEIATEDVHYLLSIADDDMMSLNNEISKLCGYVSEPTVTRADIDRLVTRSIEANRFEIADAFYAKNYNKIFDVVDRLYKQNVDDIAIANVFYRTFVDMWRTCLAYEAGKTSDDVSRDFTINRYGAAKAMKNTRNVKKSFLESAVQLSFKLDRDLKSSRGNKKDLVLAFVANVIERRQGNG